MRRNGGNVKNNGSHAAFEPVPRLVEFANKRDVFMSDCFAAFILSTGRCGTQWIAQSIGNAYADHVSVEHEPLHDRYDARKMLANRASSTVPPTLTQRVQTHLDGIQRELETRSYLECGHPCWSSIPYLAERFAGRIRIIHLIRHPVFTSYSWLTHGAYQPPLAPHLREKVLLSPHDEGVRFPEYARLWAELSPFEKCLYYWAEVHAFALDLQTRLDARWLRLKYEDVFGGDGIQQLLSFLELPAREVVFEQRTTHVDQFRYLTGAWQDWRLVRKHPHVVRVASQLGYDTDQVDEDALNRRYHSPRGPNPG